MSPSRVFKLRPLKLLLAATPVPAADVIDIETS
jgi:hypothetical protein